MPGHIAPAFFLALSILVAGPFLSASPAQAQSVTLPPPQLPPGTSRPPVSNQPVPGELELAKLLWSTMAAVDHANQSGNYSVLRDISSPGFQILNNAAALGQTFTGIREARVDLAASLLLAPTYTQPPAIVEPGVMRVRGYFGLRPTTIYFDFFFQWVDGRRRLHGIALTPQQIANEAPLERGRTSQR